MSGITILINTFTIHIENRKKHNINKEVSSNKLETKFNALSEAGMISIQLT